MRSISLCRIALRATSAAIAPRSTLRGPSVNVAAPAPRHKAATRVVDDGTHIDRTQSSNNILFSGGSAIGSVVGLIFCAVFCAAFLPLRSFVSKSARRNSLNLVSSTKASPNSSLVTGIAGSVVPVSATSSSDSPTSSASLGSSPRFSSAAPASSSASCSRRPAASSSNCSTTSPCSSDAGASFASSTTVSSFDSSIAACSSSVAAAAGRTSLVLLIIAGSSTSRAGLAVSPSALRLAGSDDATASSASTSTTTCFVSSATSVSSATLASDAVGVRLVLATANDGCLFTIASTLAAGLSCSSSAAKTSTLLPETVRSRCSS
mmetsp:Transcript_29719/g.90969  ORF Transcript_29719/g.90969 Transcript_29719/m.90969 type:complete len:321 (-) Transcript_29719:147-1109(-)